MGLVEVGVGLIPAWGGCKEYLQRAIIASEKSPSLDPPELKAFETIGTAKVSTSAQEARELLFLREGDGISMNRDYLLSDAKEKMLWLAEDYKPPEPFVYRLGGQGTKALMQMAVNDFYRQGLANWQDVRVMEVLSDVLSGGDTTLARETTERDLMKLERHGFLRMVTDKSDFDSPVFGATRNRILHTLNTSKPLREPPLINPMSPAELRQTIPTVTIKDHSADPHPLARQAKEPVIINIKLDLKAMSGKELAAHFFDAVREEKEALKPPEGALSHEFNRAIADTHEFWAKKLGTATTFIKDKNKLLASAEDIIGKSVANTKTELAKAAAPEIQSKLLGRQAVNELYLNGIRELRAHL
jgi:enoyl-CoA hydratase/carnithine racemase